MAGRGRMPRRPVHDEMHGFHDGPPPPLHDRRPMPPPPHSIEEELAMGHDEIRRLVSDNRLLLDENVAMKREIDAAREELHVLGQAIPKIRAEKEVKTREYIQMGLKLEAELRAVEPMRAEAVELQSEVKKLDALRQEMTTKIQSMTKDLKRVQAENQQIPKLRMEMESLHEDLVRVRTGYEYEQKVHVEQMEQRQAMEKNLVSMAREIEKLRARGPGTGTYGADMGYQASYIDGYGREQGRYGAGSWAPYEQRGFPRR
ncbi:uncharacterized protein A4U43_C08F28080 [Asparagus officinalis]|uniref:protein FLX-like 3 n=1 Tax=Asparagus officinalis TaxID=4686 RepID=UPI00098E1704|nr:protein FLX-like 3 [Asparagus officinalis]ONK61282.1 uncharacterized protein A4U43_C08F28080 [Asparagus officinalis]